MNVSGTKNVPVWLACGCASEGRMNPVRRTVGGTPTRRVRSLYPASCAEQKNYAGVIALQFDHKPNATVGPNLVTVRAFD